MSGKQKRIRAGEAMMKAMGGRKPELRRLKAFAAAMKAAGTLDASTECAVQAVFSVLSDAADSRRAHLAHEMAELRKEWARGMAEEIARWPKPNIDWQKLTGVTPEAMAEVEAAIMSVRPSPEGGPKRRRRRRLGPLTVRQKQAMELWTECGSNYSEVARRMGIDRKTAKQHVQAAFRKFGAEQANVILARVKRPKMQKLPEDRRGQPILPSLTHYSYGEDPAEGDDEDLKSVLPRQEFVYDQGSEDGDDEE